MAKMNESTAAIYARDANDIALTEDGTQLLAYGAAFIRSYDVATKQLMHNLPGLGSSLAVYARGKLVLIGPPQDVDADPSPNSAVLRVLEVPTGRLISVLRRLPANAYRSAINQEGTVVAANPALYDRRVLFDGGSSQMGRSCYGAHERVN